MDEAASPIESNPQSGGVSQADIEALHEASGAADTATDPQFPGEQESALDSLLQAAGGDAAAAGALSDATPDVGVTADLGALADSPIPAALQPFSFNDLDEEAAAPVDAKRVSMLHDVNLKVKIELGRTWMLVEDVLRLGEGSVVELDKLAGDPVDVFVNERLIARGEVLVLNDNFCVRINEIVAGVKEEGL